MLPEVEVAGEGHVEHALEVVHDGLEALVEDQLRRVGDGVLGVVHADEEDVAAERGGYHGDAVGAEGEVRQVGELRDPGRDLRDLVEAEGEGVQVGAEGDALGQELQLVVLHAELLEADHAADAQGQGAELVEADVQLEERRESGQRGRERDEGVVLH